MISDDKFVRSLRKAIQFCVRALAILMVFVILHGVLDVGMILYDSIIKSSNFLLSVNDIIATFGSFMAVLIAIEIFENIILYLRDDVIHVKIVMATALMAVARKVIIVDYDKAAPSYIYSLAAAVIALSLGYWLVRKMSHNKENIVEKN